MPTLSVWFIRTAMVYLVIGFSLGGLILIEKALPLLPWAWNFLPVHIEFLVLGFVIQLTMGVAFWIFPRLMTITDRGNETLMVICYVLLNSGMALSAISAFGFSLLILPSRLLELAGVISFVLHIWRRIYPFGKY
jgi:hypothetical protein